MIYSCRVNNSILAIISITILYKNTKINDKALGINRMNIRNNSIRLDLIATKQLENTYIFALVVFNPNVNAILLDTLTLYAKAYYKIPLIPMMSRWEKVENITWWPTSSTESYETKYFSEEYKNLYVEDIREIMVSVPGKIHNDKYKFFLQTNMYNSTLITNAHSHKSFFAQSSVKY